MTIKTTSFVKAGFQGGTGTGKSTTAGLLLLGLSVTYHAKAPVLVYDTEPGWQFLEPIYQGEGVKLIIENGRHFSGMHNALKKAVKEGCCGFAVDSITHCWAELLQRFQDSTGRVPFHKYNQIKPLWNDWTVDFMNAPLNSIANGRLAWEYEYEVAEDGKKELVKGDTKMKAGGGESFGYEPHLTCEMNHQRKQLKNGKLGGMQYECLVIKDRSRAINGKAFLFDELGIYKSGGFKYVLEAFRPHVEFIQKIAGVAMPKTTSEEMVPLGDTDFFRERKMRTAALEEWDATMELVFPGQSAANKRARVIAGEAISGCRSRTKLEALTSAELQVCVDILMALEKRIKLEKSLGSSAPESEADLKSMIEMAKEDLGKDTPQQKTLLQAKLEQSLEQVEQVKAQPDKPC